VCTTATHYLADRLSWALLYRYHGNGEVIRREEFAQRKQAAEELQLARLNTKAKRLASAGKKFDGLPVLQVSSCVLSYEFLSCEVPWSLSMRCMPLVIAYFRN